MTPPREVWVVVEDKGEGDPNGVYFDQRIAVQCAFKGDAIVHYTLPAPSLLTGEERARLESALAAVAELWTRSYTATEYASAHDGLRSALDAISGGGLMEHTARWLLAADARMRGDA